jgi:exodeoxyribonuclease VII large subunit
LCRAIADALDARFNPVTVTGEISGFNRASSGHAYFALKDDSGQLRCAMFRRAGGLLPFTPRDGMRVEVEGRLAVYEPRGDLQLIVESMRQAGAGALLEQFLRLKAALEAQGLFDPGRKRSLPTMPRAIGVVTSLGAAALHDVVTALQRRAPHVPVVIAPSLVQGPGAAGELVAALQALYRRARGDGAGPPVDTILLVRGGGSLEDLWAFNDEQLARVIVQSPVPVISGVGHETDFTIADWVADLRAPTPTAAAELAASPLDQLQSVLGTQMDRIRRASGRALDTQDQRLDRVAARMGRPSAMAGGQRLLLTAQARRLRQASRHRLQAGVDQMSVGGMNLARAVRQAMERDRQRLARVQLRIDLLDPSLVLRRGYAWLQDESGRVVSQVADVRAGQALTATVADGQLELTVRAGG